MARSLKRAALKMIELYFRQRVDRGLRELDEGKTISHKEVKRSVVKWLQSAGR
jgi:predicted transcriptional regulator